MKLLYFLVVLSHLSFWTGCARGNAPVLRTSTSTWQSSWRYYDGMVYVLAMLHASGKFRMYIANQLIFCHILLSHFILLQRSIA